MITVLLIIVPMLTGFISFFVKDEKSVKTLAVFSAVATLVISLISLFQNTSSVTYDASWLPMMGSRFSVSLDGMGKMVTLLTAVSFPIIFASTYNNHYKSPNAFYGFMLLTQAGLMGVFCAMDLLLFYFFWELALIPAYFLCSKWGGEKRIPVTFKFFIYTFIGSLLMLVGILYLYFLTPDKSFSIQSFYALANDKSWDQTLVFWLLFAAFAVKMPLFPFHT